MDDLKHIKVLRDIELTKSVTTNRHYLSRGNTWNSCFRSAWKLNIIFSLWDSLIPSWNTSKDGVIMLHVSEDISPFEKQDGEFELFHMIEGGH